MPTTASPAHIPISLEFFPTKTAEGADKLRRVRQQLYPLQPAFCSVTFGAGGSTQAGTFSTVAEVLAEGMDAACHFSCIGASKATVREQLGQLRAMGVKRLIALRGDLPLGYAAHSELRYASELVDFIRAETGDYFHIAVAAYPETHPQAASPTADLQAFASKVRAGADLAITQYFFNAEAYFRFRDEVQALGVHTPIVPGIMPITNATQLLRFSDACGTEIPRWLRLRLQSLGNDLAAITALGEEVVGRLCEQLIAGGAPALHFYTMNQSEPTLSLCEGLGFGQTAAPSARLRA